MGLVIDASTLIDAERQRQPVSDFVSAVSRRFDGPYLFSAVTVMEMEHGWHRAKESAVARWRRSYLDELYEVIPAVGFSREMAVLAAGIDAKVRSSRFVIATADLMIGVTALHLGYAVGTRNLRHFRMIPGLTVILL